MSNNKLYKCINSKNSVGIEFSNDTINVYFPHGYRIPIENEIEEKRSILDLIKTINICKNNGSTCEYDYNSGENNIIPINSYLWVINDYLKNGLYNVTEKKYIQSQKGKIDWKRTFKTKVLFENDEVIYLNPIIEYKTQNDNIISEIHAICINESIDKIGWLFGTIKKVENCYNIMIRNEMFINILKNELVKTFNDRKKTLLKHLINILKNKSANDNLDKVNNMLVDNYNYAWEKMIDHVFGINKELKEQYFPKIVWKLHSGNEPKNTMRPDTIINKNGKTYIIDAKYYKYGITGNGNLPGAEDVDKQLSYGDFNSKREEMDGNNIYNAFILPFNKNDDLFKSDKPIITVGTVSSIGRISDKHYPYENIVIILMDTKYLIDLYFKKESKDEDLLINSILNELK